MKLIFDCTELSYYNENSGYKAGVYYVAINLLKELKKLGVDITLKCNFKRYYFMQEIDAFKNLPLLEEYSIINKIWAKILYSTRNYPTRIKYFFLILARFYESYFYKINKKNLKDIEKFDVYFSPFTAPSKEIIKSHIKCFRMLHDAIPIIENGYPKSPKDWYYSIYTTISNNEYYVTNSEYTKKEILKLFSFISEQNIKTTLLGANENFHPTDKSSPINGNYIFSLCTLGKRKNIIFAIKNFFKFIDKNNITDLKLVLGGSIWHKFKKELKNELKNYDNTKIIFTGYINEEELKKYYSSALCFIYPSLYEGFGLPVLEAMQCGCPVITSNTTSLPEVIGDTGIQIDPTSNEDLISAYEKMYFDKSFRTECSIKGLKRANEFSWEKCATKIIDFIKSTL